MKLSPNDPCWCKGTLKYKKCHKAFDDAPDDMGVGKRMVERRVAADPALLGDASVPLRELLKAKSVAA